MRKTAMTPADRVVHYERSTKFPAGLFIGGDGRIVGTWIMGNDYRTNGHFGGYPAGYLRRIRAMFPDKRALLHLFSGRVDLAVLPGDTVDLDRERQDSCRRRRDPAGQA